MTKSLYVVTLFVSTVLLVTNVHSVIGQDLGDCDQATGESNADCDYVETCLPDSCYVNPSNICGITTRRTLPYENRLAGSCYNGYWDNGCVNCEDYWCAAVVRYVDIDQFGECQDPTCTHVSGLQNACVPT